MTFYFESTEPPETRTAPLCIDRFPDRYHEQGRHLWRSTRCSEVGLKKFNATDAGDMGIMRKIVLQGNDLVSDLEQRVGMDVTVRKGVIP